VTTSNVVRTLHSNCNVVLSALSVTTSTLRHLYNSREVRPSTIVHVVGRLTQPTHAGPPIASVSSEDITHHWWCARMLLDSDRPQLSTAKLKGRRDNQRVTMTVEDQRRLSPAPSDSTISRRSDVSGGQQRPTEGAVNTQRQSTAFIDDEGRRGSASEANRRVTSQAAAVREASLTDTDLPTSERGSAASVTGQFRLRSTVVPVSQHVAPRSTATRVPMKGRSSVRAR